jgi:DNA-binding NtrC family response regulator
MFIRREFEVFSANSVDDAMLLLQAHSVDAIVVDVNLPNRDSISLTEEFMQMFPSACLIIHTATGTVDQAYHAGAMGVGGYVDKANTLRGNAQVVDVVLGAIEKRRASGPRARVDPRQRGLLAAPVQGFYGIIAQDSKMLDIFELIQTIADSPATVLIEGETGTGKELVARAVHEASSRHGKPFVAMDCSTLSREILESELFGHEKGAFTGAVERHIGRFERANGGTLFLDEVSNIDMAVQAKLLRVLQTRTFERVGGQKSISVDVRIVAATNRPLAECVAEKTFREDLYHRLIVVQIEVPPLRQRGNDIVVLAGDFLRKFAKDHAKTIRGFTDSAIDALTKYRWPGNVRELENVILQAVVLGKSALLDVNDLPKRIVQATDENLVAGSTLSDRLTEPEKQILIDTIREHRGNIKKSAEALQISRTTLYSKLKKYQIDPATIY